MKEDKPCLFPDALARAIQTWKEDDEQRQSRRQPAAPDPSPTTDSKDDQEDEYEP